MDGFGFRGLGCRGLGFSVQGPERLESAAKMTSMVTPSSKGICTNMFLETESRDDQSPVSVHTLGS